MEKLHPVTIIQNPSYLTTYEFEKFDLPGWRDWVGQNWIISVYCSIAYVIFIFGTKYIMRNRQPFKLTKLLTTWNVLLAIFSIFAFLRCVPEFFHVLTSKNGFHNSVCKW